MSDEKGNCMRRAISAGALVLALCLPSSAAAQARAQGEADPGIKPTRMIDRAEVRVSRVEIQPGATRRVHAHNDVPFHLWVPMTGTLELTIGSEPAAAAAPGQAFFLKRGTPHGFKNVGTTPAAVLEVFVKEGAANADRGPHHDDFAALALALAAIEREKEGVFRESR
jgi:quercetin dioxygenase-like cupin family protein